MTSLITAMLLATAMLPDTGRAPLRLPDRFEQALMQPDTQETQHAVEHSDAYYTRLTIHRYASFAMIPLFAAEYYVGSKLYNGTASQSLRSLHGPLAVGIAGLFGVNTITGAMNLYESRHDKENRTKRTIHSVLMLAADAGFAATAALTPEGDEGESRFRGESEGGATRSTHRALAVSSMGAAAVSWLIMLIPTGD
jgi:hypothetical protein